LDDFANRWFTNAYGKSLIEEFVAVVPGVGYDERDPWAKDLRWREIFHASCQIRSSQTGTQLKAWRTIHKYGEEIAPGLRVFRLRESTSPRLFWLSSDSSAIGMQTRLADLLPKISAYSYIMQGMGLFHAAGIVHREKAFLFAGVSGSGKSTVSFVSKACGHQIIHDDHVVVYQGATEEWLTSNISHSLCHIPIKAVFFLVQDMVDQLIPLKSTQTARRLMDGLREHGEYVLFGDVARKGFATCAEIARKVPGFQLHFRKSPDFWKLIDEQFPD